MTAVIAMISISSLVAFSEVKDRLEHLLHSPLTGLPKYESPSPPTVEIASLGRLLFYDKRLSRDGTISCASCHQVESAFSNTNSISIGIGGATGKRKAPPILNRAFLAPQFWDGRAETLEIQASGPLLSPTEMGNTETSVVETIAGILGYGPHFEAAFGDPTVTLTKITKAISDFERTLMSGNSRWDRWIENQGSYSPEEERGYQIFLDRDCKQCHVPPFFSDSQFHNTGMGYVNGKFLDEGRFGFTKLTGLGKLEETGAFKTPTLRNLTSHAPYMHDGSLKTLDDVIEFYNKGGIRNPYLSEKIIPLGLSSDEKRALLAFLRSLDGEGFEEVPPHASEFPQ